jgi:hypothetical protein
MKTSPRNIWPLLLTWILLAALPSGLSLADGTETLGPPAGITIATGTGFVAAGVGLEDKLPHAITFTVPTGATVKQVLFYWEGQTPENGAVDVQFKINGIDVTATDPGGTSAAPNRIASPVYFYTTPGGQIIYSLAYRYDITALNLVGPGANSLTIAGLDGFDFVNDGAGVMVIYEESGKPLSHIDLRDGLDLAFINFPSPRDATVLQEFTFPASDKPRQATLAMFFSSVSGIISGSGTDRPSSIEVTVGGVTTKYSNLLKSNDGQEWDTQNIPVAIPAGETKLSVQAFSRDDLSTGNLPASFFWLAAGLSIAEKPPESGEGCTPGYWKQPHHFGNWPAPYKPNMLFADVFENAFPGMTLLQVLQQGGGGLIALGRHTVAALLNGASDYVNYGLTAGEVIQQFNQVFPSSTKNGYQALHTMFADLNERKCPLGRAEAIDDLVAKGLLNPKQPGVLQNYPNPFNPTTQIVFNIPEATTVTIRIYNMLGQLVRTLNDGILEAGLHSVVWDATDNGGNHLPSGIYIYRLQAGDYNEIRKMTLMR